MLYLFLQLWEIMINGIEAFLYYLLVKKKIKAKEMPYRSQKITLFLCCQVALLYVFNHFGVSTLITIGFFDIVRFLFTIYFFYAPLFPCLFWIIIYTILCMLADMMTILLPTVLANVNVNTILLGGAFRIPITFAYISLLSLFIFLIILLTDKQLFFTLRQKIAFSFLSLTSMIVAQYIFAITLKTTTKKVTREIANSLGIICFLFVILFVSLLVFVYQLGVAKQKNITYLEEKAQFELEQAQFNNILEMTHDLRTLKHDMNLYLDTIEILASQNKNDKLLEYIADYRKHIDNIHHFLSTGNTAIDCIVSTKLSAAKQKGIQVSYSILLPQKIPLDDISLCSLIGNLFNNAIEACEKISPDKKDRCWINFTIQPYQNMFGIYMENGSNGEYLFDKNGMLLSTKSDTAKKRLSHGIGLKRIQELAEQADGLIDINPGKEDFKLHIMIPLLEKDPDKDPDGSTN